MIDYFLYTDGGSRGNPGPAGVGMVVMNNKYDVLKKGSKALGVMTNNEAEYWAVIEGLQLLKKTLNPTEIKTSQIELRLDSELVARQLQGKYQIKDENLGVLFIKIWNLRVKYFPQLKIKHILRGENKKADALANVAMDELKNKPDRLL